MKKILLSILAVFLLLLIVIGINAWILNSILKDILSNDKRNNGIIAFTYFKPGSFFSEIVVDIRSATGKSHADVERVLEAFAEKKRETTYAKVHLAYKGKSRIYLDGKFFSRLGDEYARENYLYGIHNLYDHVYYSNGQKVFQTVILTNPLDIKDAIKNFNMVHNYWWGNYQDLI